MIESIGLLCELGLRSTVVLASAGLLTALLAARSPRIAHRIAVLGCLALLALPALLVVVPRVGLPGGLIPLPVPAPRSAETSTPNPVTAAGEPAPWDRVRYERPDARPWLIFLAIYAIGLAVASIRLLRSWLRLRSLGRAAIPAPELAPRRAAGPERRPLFVHPDCSAPWTVGILRPKIVLPADAGTWPPGKLRAAVAHEEAHIQHHDPLWNLLAHLALALYWVHPGVWLLRRGMAAVAERACDDEAVERTGSPGLYAKALLEIAAEAGRRGNRLPPLTAPMAGSAVPARLERILARPGGHGSRGGWRRSLALTAALLLVAFGSVGKIEGLRSGPPLAESPLARPLLAAITADEPNAKAEALFKLARWQGRESEVMAVLVESLGDDRPIETMPRWSFTTEGWGPAFDVFQAPSPGEVAALGLASFGCDAAPSLVAALASPSAAVRRNAAWALGELRHPRRISRTGIGRLVAALEDPDPTVRAAAVWSLGDIGVASARGEVERMLRTETDPRARRLGSRARRALDDGVSLEHYRNNGQP